MKFHDGMDVIFNAGDAEPFEGCCSISMSTQNR
jgi:hypothetical protein